MNQFPDWLYQLTRRDQQITVIDHVRRRETLTGISQSEISINGPIIAQDKIFCGLVQFSASAVGTPIGLCLESIATVAAANGTLVADIAHGHGNIGVGGIKVGHSVTVENVLLFPNTRIVLRGEFSTNGPGNSITLSMYGVLIPRGNVGVSSL